MQELPTRLQERLDQEFQEENSTPLDYMARGNEIPPDVLGFTLFLQTQQQQLLDMHVPENLWRKLYHKLKDEIFDSGSVFQFAFDEDDDRIKLIVSDEVPNGVIAANSDIFLVDHFWTSTVENSMNQLRTVPNLLERLCGIFEITGKRPTIACSSALYLKVIFWNVLCFWTLQMRSKNKMKQNVRIRW